jgi:predicted nuclease of restriction endonuclease-like (RecB) superfamily
MATTRKTAPRKTPAPTVQESSTAQDYPALLAEVKTRIHSAQLAALRAVNQALVGLYWDIGRLIVERQQREGWGKAVVEQLAADLQADFPGAGGFSASNLWRMKSLFKTYSGAEKLAPLVREIGWSHNLLILERCKKDMQEREFYLRMTRKFGWSKNVLAHQIDNQSFEMKIGEFEPEFVGKMQFYLAALDAQVRQPDENPSIGIILCKEKRRTIVEYALLDARKPIGVATYQITKTLPKNLRDQLPSPEAIARLLESL